MTTLIKADTAAEAAAIWWAEQIGAPVFRNVDQQSSPEERELGGFAGIMGSLIADRYPVNDEAGRKFVEALTPKIQEQLDRYEWTLSLGVDYGPDLMLAKAADAAGVHPSRFPWKTNMWVHRDYVTAGLGYRAQPVLIWSSPSWERPKCGEHRYENDEPLLEVCSLPRYHAEDHGQWKPDDTRCRECGGTYVDHFGTAGWEKRRKTGDFHSWTPQAVQS